MAKRSYAYYDPNCQINPVVVINKSINSSLLVVSNSINIQELYRTVSVVWMQGIWAKFQ